MLVRFFPIFEGKEFELDFSAWRASGDGGGFGQTFICADDPSHILKRLHLPVPRISSLRERTSRAAHSRKMAAELARIANEPGQHPYVVEQCLRLKGSLSTHIGWSAQDERVLLYQPKAQGRDLNEILLLESDEPPTWFERLRLAKNFVGAMGALSRSRVVHLDCDPTNIFVDKDQSSWPVTLIDLDGCGIPRLFERGESEWQTPPDTLGKLTSDWRPVWFPFDASWQAPVRGNFLFAQSWCVLLEVWRCFTWGCGTLVFWHDLDISNPYSLVRNLFESESRGREPIEYYQVWTYCQQAVADQLATHIGDAYESAFRTDWGRDFGIGSGSERDNEILSHMAAVTALGLLKMRDPAMPPSKGRPMPQQMPQWDGPRMLPNWQWVQNRLNDLGGYY